MFFGYNALIAFLSSIVVGLTGSGPHGESVGCKRAGPGRPTKERCSVIRGGSQIGVPRDPMNVLLLSPPSSTFVENS